MENVSQGDPLVLLARAGDRRAFEMLVVQHQRRVARLVSRYVRNATDVEDLVQETFIRAWRGLDSFRGDSSFGTWLYRIATNLSLNHIKRTRPTVSLSMDHEESPDGPPEPAEGEDPERMLMAREIGATVERALAELNEDYRRALLLYEMDGRQYKEIAALTNAPIGTVRARIFRAREHIAARLEPLLTPTRGRRW